MNLKFEMNNNKKPLTLLFQKKKNVGGPKKIIHI